MIKRTLNVDNYWKVIVYSNIDYNLFHIIADKLYQIGLNKSQINSIYNNMFYKKAKAVTISSLKYNISIILFNKHKSYTDFINSIVHESEHIKQAILDAYNVKDYGEPPAYTVGYIASQLIVKLLVE